MNRIFVRTLVVCLVAGLVLAPAANAILGMGDVVFDPTNYEEALRHFLQLERQYEQLVQQYLVLKNQYDHMRLMSQPVPVNMISRYKALATPWHLSSATDTYGTTGRWMSGINSGAGIASGYSRAAEPLGQYGSAFSNIPTEQQDRVKTSYTTVELTDGAIVCTRRTPLNATSSSANRSGGYVETCLEVYLRA